MVGIAVPTIVFSTAAMKVAIMQAARIRLRRPVTTGTSAGAFGEVDAIAFPVAFHVAVVLDRGAAGLRIDHVEEGVPAYSAELHELLEDRQVREGELAAIEFEREIGL